MNEFGTFVLNSSNIESKICTPSNVHAGQFVEIRCFQNAMINYAFRR